MFIDALSARGLDVSPSNLKIMAFIDEEVQKEEKEEIKPPPNKMRKRKR